MNTYCTSTCTPYGYITGRVPQPHKGEQWVDGASRILSLSTSGRQWQQVEQCCSRTVCARDTRAGRARARRMRALTARAAAARRPPRPPATRRARSPPAERAGRRAGGGAAAPAGTRPIFSSLPERTRSGKSSGDHSTNWMQSRRMKMRTSAERRPRRSLWPQARLRNHWLKRLAILSVALVGVGRTRRAAAQVNMNAIRMAARHRNAEIFATCKYKDTNCLNKEQ